MGTEYRVVVEGGGRNLYYIKEEDGTYHVYHHLVNLVWDDENLIASEDTLDDALEAIEEHSGEDIDEVDEL